MGTTKNERVGTDIQHVELMMNRGLSLRDRRLVLGIPYMEHNSDNDVSFPFAANILTAMDVLEFQYEEMKNNVKKKKDHIDIVLITYGGDCYHMFGIHDRIKTCRVPVDMYVCGPCMSAGTIILQAARRRYMSPNSDLMLHYGSSYDEGSSHPARLEEYTRQEKDVIRRMVKIYLSRTKNDELAKDGREHMRNELRRLCLSSDAQQQEAIDKQVEEVVKSMQEPALADKMLQDIILSKDTYLDAEKCLRYGLVDEIIPEFVPEPFLTEN